MIAQVWEDSNPLHFPMQEGRLPRSPSHCDIFILSLLNYALNLIASELGKKKKEEDLVQIRVV